MRIALGQIGSRPGDVEFNLATHCRVVEMATDAGAEVVIFPELSITGYEPSLAREFMRPVEGWQLAELQRLADEGSVHICFGAPVEGTTAPKLSMILLGPEAEPGCASKMHLHADELPFFGRATEYTGLVPVDPVIGLAICYEITVSEHTETVFRSGAQVYAASVAKTAAGVADAHARLQVIALERQCPVLMVNAVGACDDFVSGGRSAAWDRDGRLLGQLDEASAGMLCVDLESGAAPAFGVSAKVGRWAAGALECHGEHRQARLDLRTDTSRVDREHREFSKF